MVMRSHSARPSPEPLVADDDRPFVGLSGVDQELAQRFSARIAGPSASPRTVAVATAPSKAKSRARASGELPRMASQRKLQKESADAAGPASVSPSYTRRQRPEACNRRARAARILREPRPRPPETGARARGRKARGSGLRARGCERESRRDKKQKAVWGYQTAFWGN
jgi:hypothetical protein